MNGLGSIGTAIARGTHFKVDLQYGEVYYNRTLAKPFLWKFQGYPEND
jgi:hypothetical protein